MNNYRVFYSEQELPKDCEITVVMPDDSDDGSYFIGQYCNGSYVEEPNSIALTDIDVPITKFINDGEELFVHADAEENVKYAFGYAEIYEKCHGNFDKIAEMLDDQICIIKNVEEEII